MLYERRTTATSKTDAGEEYVEFTSSGAVVVGAFHCSGCGYGVTVHSALPACPMCTGTTWEQVAWSPFSRADRR